jgi:hypothetical protein
VLWLLLVVIVVWLLFALVVVCYVFVVKTYNMVVLWLSCFCVWSFSLNHSVYDLLCCQLVSFRCCVNLNLWGSAEAGPMASDSGVQAPS